MNIVHVCGKICYKIEAGTKYSLLWKSAEAFITDVPPCFVLRWHFCTRKCVSFWRDVRKQYACAISISELPSLPLLHIQLAGTTANQHVLSVCEWKIQRAPASVSTLVLCIIRQQAQMIFSFHSPPGIKRLN